MSLFFDPFHTSIEDKVDTFWWGYRCMTVKHSHLNFTIQNSYFNGIKSVHQAFIPFIFNTGKSFLMVINLLIDILNNTIRDTFRRKSSQVLFDCCIS